RVKTGEPPSTFRECSTDRIVGAGNTTHPSSRGPRLRPDRGALGSPISREPLGCDPARPDGSERPQPARWLINVNTATTTEQDALTGIGPKRLEEIRPLATAA